MLKDTQFDTIRADGRVGHGEYGLAPEDETEHFQSEDQRGGELNCTSMIVSGRVKGKQQFVEQQLEQHQTDPLLQTLIYHFEDDLQHP